MQKTQELINFKEMSFLSLELYEVQLRKEVISDLIKSTHKGQDKVFSKVLFQLTEKERELIQAVHQYKKSYLEIIWEGKVTKFVVLD